MYLQPIQGNQGNTMRAAAQLRLHSPGERWSWEAASSALLPGCLLESKRGWRFDKWLIMKTLVPKLKL